MNNEQLIAKKNNKGLILILIITIILAGAFTACDNNQNSDEASLAISLINSAASNERSVDNKAILYKISITGNGTPVNLSAYGGQTVSATVSLGQWYVGINGYYPDENTLYSTGGAPVDVKPGPNRVEIKMSLVSGGGGDTDGGDTGGGTSTHSVTVSAGTGGTVTGSGTYAAGETVEITASPSIGYSFTGWSATGVTLTNTTSDVVSFTMPNNAVTITANFTVNSYNVTINSVGGTPSGVGSHAYGSTVNISTTVDAGYSFANWTSSDVPITNATSSTNASFVMPASDVTITANFTSIDPAKYIVTVINGTGSSLYAAGDPVNITASAFTGLQFKNWTKTSAGVTFIDPNMANTSFTMPSNAVTVTAKYDLVSPVTSDSLQRAINFAESGETITVPAGNHTLNTQININKVITIVGTAPGTTLTSNPDIYLFYINNGTLNLGGNNISLTLNGQGSGYCGARLIFNSNLNMYEGVTISGFYRGVIVLQTVAHATFTMYGGIIENNNTDGVWANGNIIMYDGIIKNNQRYGVYIQSGATFTMHGGTITGTADPEPNGNYAFYRTTGTGAAGISQYGNGTPITTTTSTIRAAGGAPVP